MSAYSSSSVASGLILGAISSNESDFFAEEELITISPKIEFEYESNHVIKFYSGTVGPIEINKHVKVPIWLAITLKKKGLCSIIIPEWLNAQRLKEILEHERTSQAYYPLDFYYIEKSRFLLTYAQDDFGDESVDEISSLVQDIENIRMDRLRNSLKELANQFVNKETKFNIGETIPYITNCSSLEIQAVKKFVIESIAIWGKLEEPVERNETSNERQRRRNSGEARRLRR